MRGLFAAHRPTINPNGSADVNVDYELQDTSLTLTVRYDCFTKANYCIFENGPTTDLLCL